MPHLGSLDTLRLLQQADVVVHSEVLVGHPAHWQIVFELVSKTHNVLHHATSWFARYVYSCLNLPISTCMQTIS